MLELWRGKNPFPIKDITRFWSSWPSTRHSTARPRPPPPSPWPPQSPPDPWVGTAPPGRGTLSPSIGPTARNPLARRVTGGRRDLPSRWSHLGAESAAKRWSTQSRKERLRCRRPKSAFVIVVHTFFSKLLLLELYAWMSEMQYGVFGIGKQKERNISYI